ncbi:hypothetical protein BN1708_003754 [Verticillium longisporum]|uniref:GTP cyclohydrolase 1 n=1 Tax=Verticillium longisporum TaxID=100787 RepID=A0A0G4LPU4_VERLO|nr:hypothetical protein BN1708_003754 [Verticillium longisporum]
MAGSEVTSSERRHRRRHNGHGDAADAPHNASDADTASSHSSKASNSKKRKHHHHKSAVSSPEASDADTASQSSKRSKKSKRRHAEADARAANGGAKRRPSLSQPARDPRDITEEEDKPVVRTPSPVIDFDGLSRPWKPPTARGTRERLEENPDQAAERLQKMQAAVRTVLECVGEDPDRSGIVDTPKRYAKAMLDFTQGYQQNVGDIVNNAIFQEGHNEMVIVKDIEIFSLCEHHLVPFTGKMHIAYIPKNQVIGISKLPRIAEMFSRRLQIQERLTKEVANAIMEVLKPQGVAVVMESSHLCMVMRGVQKTTASTITSCVLGCFETKSKTRNEFLSLVGLKKT